MILCLTMMDMSPDVNNQSRAQREIQRRITMQQSLFCVTLVVDDYDKAIDFYVNTLNFELLEDEARPEQNKRWVTVAPQNHQGAKLLLAKASKPEQIPRVGDQTGGRVGFFLNTDDFWRDYRDYQSKGVTFVREPVEQDYGIVAVFADLYGNLWDLIGPKL